MKDEVKYILENKCNINSENIVEISMLHEGYTNSNYLVELKNGNKLITRISKGNNKNHTNEKNAYNADGTTTFLFFDEIDGTYVKEYINGNQVNLEDKNQLKLVIEKVIDLSQSINVENIDQMDWNAYKNFNSLDEIQTLLFNSLVLKHSVGERVFCHHDLNEGNILYIPNLDQIVFIDFEWARMDDIYFEWATLALNPKVNEDHLIELASLDKAKLLEYKYMVQVLSHMWCNYINDERSNLLAKKILMDINSLMDKIL